MKTKKNFSTMVHDIVRQIPKGSVASYGQVAIGAGSPGAARAVGSIMKNNYNPTVPCHRVIKSDGRLGRYNRKDITKEEMLRREGIDDCSPKNLKKLLHHNNDD